MPSTSREHGVSDTTVSMPRILRNGHEIGLRVSRSIGVGRLNGPWLSVVVFLLLHVLLPLPAFVLVACSCMEVWPVLVWSRVPETTPCRPGDTRGQGTRRMPVEVLHWLWWVGLRTVPSLERAPRSNLEEAEALS